MITPMAAIFGKGGVGKTLLTAHLAMAFSYSGSRTLVVGCDLKRDTQRALCPETRPSVMEALELAGFDYGAVDPGGLLAPASPYVDVVELGPAPLLVADYAAVYEQGFHYFGVHHLLDRYAQVLFDVNDERFDAGQVPLLRHVDLAIAVTDESLESLFVLNRLLRAVLIGGHEFEFPTRLLGVVNNRSTDPRVFERFVERTKCFPLMTIPALAELAALRPAHRTVFAEQDPPRHLDVLIDGFLKIAQLVQSEPFLLEAIMPLEDEDVWTLADGLGERN